MNYKTFFLGLMVTIIGFSIFSFNTTNQQLLQAGYGKSWGQNASFVTLMVQKLPKLETLSEKKFLVHSGYGGTITGEVLMSSDSFSDFLSGGVYDWIEKYDSVRITAMLNHQQISLLGYENKISDEQRKIFSNIESGTELKITIDYQRYNPVTLKIDYDRIDFYYRVVPFKEAVYPLGNDSLIAFFNHKSKAEFADKKLMDVQPMVAVFTIDENGDVKNIQLTRSSGYPEVDKQILGFISQMPAWRSAEDANGKRVSQNFELVFGNPGC